MKEMTTKLTAEIDRDTYAAITKNLHHGQLTQLVRAFTQAMEIMIADDKKGELYLWLYDNQPLSLPPPVKSSD